MGIFGGNKRNHFCGKLWVREAQRECGPSAVIDIYAKVHNFWDRNGWNMDSLYSCLPDHIVAQIVHVPSGFNGCGANV